MINNNRISQSQLQFYKGSIKMTTAAPEAQKQQQHPLQKIIEKQTKIITNDGRVFVGILRGLDQAMNCIMSECEQRIYSQETPVRRQKLGVYFIRGDSIVVMGEFVEDEEELAALQQLKCKPLGKCE